MKKFLDANRGFIAVILLVAVVLLGVKVCAESLVDSSTQKSFISGNNQYYNATQQIGFYEMDTSVAGTTIIRYSSSNTNPILIEKIQVVTTSTYHTKSVALWANRHTSAVYIPWNDSF